MSQPANDDSSQHLSDGDASYHEDASKNGSATNKPKQHQQQQLTPRQPLKDNETHKVNRKSWNDMMKRELGEGYSFTKKKCFVCGSLSHLIKDCDYYEKKMAREAEVKRVVNTGNKDQLEDFEEFNGGSVTFGGSKGYISGKGKPC
ncbi:ribonuclease H-like domain-containing protein [Tanacetum coccineum]